MTHPDWIDGVVVWWLFSAGTANLPPPRDGDRWYGWLYHTLQALAANFPPFLQARTGAVITARTPDTSTTVVLK